jgi:hypothetical protein
MRGSTEAKPRNSSWTLDVRGDAFDRIWYIRRYDLT